MSLSRGISRKIVCVYSDVWSSLPSLFFLSFLRSGHRCEWRVDARFCSPHPHWKALVGKALATCSACNFPLNLTGNCPVAGLILNRAIGELDLIMCDWCCVGRTQISQTMLSRLGGLRDSSVTERLQVHSRHEPESPLFSLLSLKVN